MHVGLFHGNTLSNQIHNIQITNKIHFNVYDVFYFFINMEKKCTISKTVIVTKHTRMWQKKQGRELPILITCLNANYPTA